MRAGNPEIPRWDAEALIKQAEDYADRKIASFAASYPQRSFNKYPSLAGYLEGQLKMVCEEANQLSGAGVKPDSGCEMTTRYLDDSPVQIMYEVQKAQPAILDPDHPGVGPGCEAAVNILQVFINGRWTDAAYINELTLRLWEESILESLAEEADE